MSVNQDRILEWMKAHPGPHSISEISKAVGISYNSARCAMTGLKKFKIAIPVSWNEHGGFRWELA